MTVTTYKWTIERYHRAIEAGIFDDQPIELLRGDLIVMQNENPMPTTIPKQLIISAHC